MENQNYEKNTLILNSNHSAIGGQLKESSLIDSMVFELVDTLTKLHRFNSFSLTIYADSTYLFDFNFSGGYFDVETGPYLIKGDSLTLISEAGNTIRVLTFVNTIEESDFRLRGNVIFVGTPFLKVRKLNIDWSSKNPKPRE